MGKKDKLIKKLRSCPKDFTFNEAETLLSFFFYHRNDKGKTSGSRVMFSNTDTGSKIILHKPHPGNELRQYQIKQLLEILEQEGLL